VQWCRQAGRVMRNTRPDKDQDIRRQCDTTRLPVLAAKVSSVTVTDDRSLHAFNYDTIR